MQANQTQFDQILTHELQLDNQLGQCVQAERRSDFALMLAMLSDDVREHSAFVLPDVEVEQLAEDKRSFRRLFDLPDEAPLAVSSMDDLPLYNQAHQVDDPNLHDIQLQNALNPLPLAFRDDKSHIDSQVMSNTSLHCQKRRQQQDKPLTKQLPFNSDLWLKSVEKSLVASPLIELDA